MLTNASFTIGFYKIVINGLSNTGILGWAIDSTELSTPSRCRR